MGELGEDGGGSMPKVMQDQSQDSPPSASSWASEPLGILPPPALVLQ